MQHKSILDWADIRTPDLTRGQRSLLKDLTLMAGEDRLGSYPSAGILAQIAGVGIRQIHKDLAVLKLLGYITKRGDL